MIEELLVLVLELGQHPYYHSCLLTWVLVLQLVLEQQQA
jgi:hypothetical protein